MEENLQLHVGSETVGGNAQYFIECSTAGMNLPDSDFSIDFTTGNDANIYSVLFQLQLRHFLRVLTRMSLKELRLTLVTKNLFLEKLELQINMLIQIDKWLQAIQVKIS